MSALQNLYQKARAETCKILGFNAKRLTPAQTMRLDCAVALRLALDDMQGRIIRGEMTDVTKMLTASEALSRLLPATVLASPPPEHRVDPRETMLQIYLDALERGELVDRQQEPSLRQRLQEVEPKLRERIAELEAEVKRLRSSDKVITPREADITPPSEYLGVPPMRGPDDPPRRSAPVIEGKAAPAAAAPKGPPAPASDAEREANVRRINATPPPANVMRSNPGDEPWRAYTHLFV